LRPTPLLEVEDPDGTSQPGKLTAVLGCHQQLPLEMGEKWLITFQSPSHCEPLFSENKQMIQNFMFPWNDLFDWLTIDMAINTVIVPA